MGNRRVPDCPLEPGKVISVRYKGETDISVIVKALDDSVTVFEKYDISGAGTVHIGQAEDCEISIKDPFISRRHAVITRRDGGCFITDRSTNGTYINGIRPGVPAAGVTPTVNCQKL